MTKSAMIRARIDPTLKAQAEGVLKGIGLSTSDLISMTYKQVVLRQGLPFEARIPNVETQQAITSYEADKLAGRLETFESADALFESLDSNVGEESNN